MGGRVGGVSFALLTPGPVSDVKWNASAAEGLLLIKWKLGAQTALMQTASPRCRLRRPQTLSAKTPPGLSFGTVIDAR